MSDDSNEDHRWPAAMLAEQFQKASGQAVDRQLDLFQDLLTPPGMGDMGDLAQFTNFGMGAATFKTRVQSGGRISIPDAEREALNIGEGDIVQTIIVPVKRQSTDTEE